MRTSTSPRSRLIAWTVAASLTALASVCAQTSVWAQAPAAAPAMGSKNPNANPPAGANQGGGGGGARKSVLDLSTGVQIPARDTSKLPTTFEGAAKTQQADPSWGKKAYKPTSRRDFTGIWLNQGGIGWTPGIAPGVGQKPPLTPEYQKIFDTNVENARLGKPTGDITANCLPQGMPRIMTMTYPMEISMTPTHVTVYAEWEEQTRRIYTDGRPLDPDPDPTFYGQSVGHWEGDVLVSTSFGFVLETNLESSGLPKSDKMIAYERVWLADDDTLRDEITLVDPKALAKPWTVTKVYKRAPADFTLMPYVCLENNRNPIDEKGQIQAIIKTTP
jgi:hypothetical protein